MVNQFVVILVFGLLDYNVRQASGLLVSRALVEERLLKMLWTKNFPEQSLAQRTHLVQLVVRSKDYSPLLDNLQRVRPAQLDQVIELLGQLMVALIE